MRKFPQHGRNVSLVLDLTTGLVSAQFHVKHDSSFDVVKQQSFKSNWPTKVGFITKREQEIGKELKIPTYPKSKTKVKHATTFSIPQKASIQVLP